MDRQIDQSKRPDYQAFGRRFTTVNRHHNFKNDSVDPTDQLPNLPS